MRCLIAIVASTAVFCGALIIDSIDFTSSFPIITNKAQAYYGTPRRVARRTARRTARRVARRHNYYRPVAPVVGAPVAAAAAGLAIGATVASLPPACSNVVINGITYYNCGGTYYQRAYDGPNVVYVVVQPPQ